MILVIDVGNTNITIGVYDEKKLVTTFRMMTKTPRTSDEFGVMITDMMHKNMVDIKLVEGCIISSVVPNVMHALNGAIKRYVTENVLVVGPGIKSGLRIMTENPREIGADRIVDAVAAYEKYGGPVLVIDYGTATTYDLVTKDYCFVAGVTAPGIRISAEALWCGTAKLPEIEIKKPASILAKETISSMQAGLVYGQIGQTEYIIQKYKEESVMHDMKVIATGGLGRIIFEETQMIDHYDSTLTLDGLRLIYEKNRK